MIVTFERRLSCSMSAAQLSFLDLIMKSASPRLGGCTLALGKAADRIENPKWRMNWWYSRVLSVLVMKVLQRSRISPRDISGRMSNLSRAKSKHNHSMKRANTYMAIDYSHRNEQLLAGYLRYIKMLPFHSITFNKHPPGLLAGRLRRSL